MAKQIWKIGHGDTKTRRHEEGRQRKENQFFSLCISFVSSCLRVLRVKAFYVLVIAMILACGLEAARAEDAATQPTTQGDHHKAKEATTKPSGDEPVVTEHTVKGVGGEIEYKD